MIDAEAISEVCPLDVALVAIVAVSSVNARIEAERQDFGLLDQLQAKKDEIDHLSHLVFVFGAR